MRSDLEIDGAVKDKVAEEGDPRLDIEALPATKEEMLDAIDLGFDPGKRAEGRRGRTWTLDPIDGTKPFLSGGQYAVCLCLIEGSEQKVGVLGCPRLYVDLEALEKTGFGGPVVDDGLHDLENGRLDSVENGSIISAVQGQGAHIRPISPGGCRLLPARVVPRKVQTGRDLRFIDYHSSTCMDVALHAQLFSDLTLLPASAWPTTCMRSMQMRFVTLAVGGGDVMIRLPRKKGHAEKIWDFAGGALIFEEVGGKVTDLEGGWG
jgi:3'(2'), 5'-bisphosphate nucleotidase